MGRDHLSPKRCVSLPIMLGCGECMGIAPCSHCFTKLLFRMMAINRIFFYGEVCLVYEVVGYVVH